MAFWGISLKPGARQVVKLPEDNVLHLSQVCLHEPKQGKTYLQAEVSNVNYTFACLEKDKVEHSTVDLFFGPTPPTFVNKGTSEVHLSGYFEPLNEAEDDDEATPIQATAKAAAKAAPKQKVPEDTESGDEEEEESEDAEAEESEEEAPAPPKKAAPAPAGKKAGKAVSVDPAKKPAPAEVAKKAEQPKRKAPEEAAGDAKKAKTGTPTTSPKTGPAAGATQTPDINKYVQQIADFLKANGGKSKLSDIGSKVKRPEGCPKLKALMDKNKDTFNLNGDNVELKK